MLNRGIQAPLKCLVLSLLISCLTSGCAVPDREEKTESETQRETVTEAPAETESETELQTDISFTSEDETIRITLPDSTWNVTRDEDEMRAFSSGSTAMINIVHADDETSMKDITVIGSEDELKESLTKQYSGDDAYEILKFEESTSAALNTCEYVVKYNYSTSMWAYSVTYTISSGDEAYVVTGTVTEDDEALLASVQRSVESFAVVNHPVFSALSGTTVSSAESETETEPETETGTGAELNAEGELTTLREYGTTEILYASADEVNVREQPSTEAEVIGSLSIGDAVTASGETAQWFRVNVSGMIGYVSKAYLVSAEQETEQTEEMEETEKPEETAQTEETVQTEETDDTEDTEEMSYEDEVTAELNSEIDYESDSTYYTTAEVNMRTQPSTASAIVGSISDETAVTVIGETDSWYVVSVNGITAYVSKDYVTADDADAEEAATEEETVVILPTTGTGVVSGTITASTLDTVTIEAGAGISYTVSYAEASVSDGCNFAIGLYITAAVDYSRTTEDGFLYATAVTGS